MGNISNPMQARPTIYKGIEMRSRLEATWAAEFASWGYEWEYEPHCFAGDGGQYLPDFLVLMPKDDGDVRACYYEVKGRVLDPYPIILRMETIWESEPDAFLILIEGPNTERRWWMGGIGGSYKTWHENYGDESLTLKVPQDRIYPPEMMTGEHFPIPRFVKV